MEFRILGPIEVLADGEPVRLGGAKERSLLTLLLLRAGEVVPSTTLIDELWGESPPETAANALQVYVSHLRKALPGMLVTRAPGYLLEFEGSELDLDRFQRLAGRGREELAAGNADEASRLLANALAQWRGGALAGAELLVSGRAEAARLEELRIAAVEDRVDADLALGRHAAVVPELERLVRSHPLRERPRAQLILALYRSERQADALAAYRDARRALDELGLEPGPALRDLERAVLQQDERLGPPVGARRELPVAASPLVGRERELGEAVELARDGARLLTFTGPGGIGKTRLALEVARELGADAFVDLTPIVDVRLVAPTIGAALGVAGQGGSAEDALVAHLRERGGLLLLDNFEQLLEAGPLLSRLLASAPRLRLLVTSRAVLRLSGEREFPVPPLEPSTSLALFIERARSVAPDLSLREGDEAIAEICERLDGVPLAIELAAARTKLLPPPLLLERLGSRLELLTGGARDAPERQRTLRATLDWSYDLLEPGEQRLLAALAVFVGGCTLEAAEAVCGGGDVLDGLSSLVDKSLVRARRGRTARFAMLEIVREYAGERLAASGEEDDLRRRHAAHFLELAERVELERGLKEEADWLAVLEDEHDNLRAAIRFALDAGEGGLALRIAVSLRRFWELHGHLAEARTTFDAALAAAADAPALLRVLALNGAGIAAGEQGDLTAAQDYFERALVDARELGAPDRIAAALTNLGNIALFAEEYERARLLYEESVELRRTAGVEIGLEAAIENLGHVALAQGDVARAIEHYEDARATSRAMGALHTVSSASRSLARALILERRAGDALPHLDESLRLAHELGEPHGLAESLEAFAGAAAVSDDWRRAALLFGAADAIRASIGAQRAPDQQRWYEHVLRVARDGIDRETFAVAYDEGRRLSAEDAVALTLLR